MSTPHSPGGRTPDGHTREAPDPALYRLSLSHIGGYVTRQQRAGEAGEAGEAGGFDPVRLARLLAYTRLVLREHRRQVRLAGGELPPALEALALLHDRFSARDRQEPPILDDEGGGGSRLLVDYEDAAWRLSVSRRTVERLVGDGRLPVVHVGGRRLIAVDELAGFVARSRRADGSARSGARHRDDEEQT